MTIVLDSWVIRWRSIAFRLDNGMGKVRWFSRKAKHCRGWAHKYKGVWFALWNSRSGLVFQEGKKRWEINCFDCTYKVRDLKCTFEILRSGEIIYALEYAAPNDIVWDNLDLEMNDFFYWVSKVWNEPSLRSQYTSSWEIVEE